MGYKLHKALSRPDRVYRFAGLLTIAITGVNTVFAHLHGTRRETEVLRMMAGGCSNHEIAEALELSEGAVKNYVSSVLSKSGVRDRTRAVLKGIELGYV